MAKRKPCTLPCPSDYDKPVSFMREPDGLTEWNETTDRDFSEWRTIGRAYAKIHTSGSRAFYAASQQHQAVDAVIEVQWTPAASRIVNHNAIKHQRKAKDVTWWIVIAAINVDEADTKMQFVCRKATPIERQKD